MTIFYFWCGHASGMTVVHVFCLTLRRKTNNWCPSPSQQGPYLCPCLYRNSVLPCSPEWRACLDLQIHLAEVSGEHEGLKHSPRAKGGLGDGTVHPILQPHSCPEMWCTEFHKMEKNKPERSGDSVIQIFTAYKLRYLHWTNKLITCSRLGTYLPLSGLCIQALGSIPSCLRAGICFWFKHRGQTHNLLSLPCGPFGSSRFLSLDQSTISHSILTHLYPRRLVQALWFLDLAFDLLFGLE